jgi:hydrogenase small subunit
VRLAITRRDLLRAGSLAAALSALNWSAIVRAASAAVREGLAKVVWFEAQSCTGDTTAIIQATDPTLEDVLLGTTPLVPPGTVVLLAHDTVLPPWGAYHIRDPSDVADRRKLYEYLETQAVEGVSDADRHLEEIAEGKYGPYVLVLEGSFPQEADIPGTNIRERGGYYCVVGHRTCAEWLKHLLKNALAVVTVGNCSSYGGMPANKVLEPPPGFTPPSWSPSPTGSLGFFDDPIRGYRGMIHQSYFEPEVLPFRKYIDEGGVPDLKTSKPAVALPGCPVNGNAIVRTLALAVLVVAGILKPHVLRREDFLDEYARPRFIYGRTVHEQCPRAGAYTAGDLREYPGSSDYKCLFSVGCKGPISNCPWNKVGWIAGVGGPVRAGGVCIGCTMPGFSDAYEPFWKALPAPTLPPVSTIAAAAGAGVVLGAIGAYLFARRARERE